MRENMNNNHLICFVFESIVKRSLSLFLRYAYSIRRIWKMMFDVRFFSPPGKQSLDCHRTICTADSPNCDISKLAETYHFLPFHFSSTFQLKFKHRGTQYKSQTSLFSIWKERKRDKVYISIMSNVNCNRIITWRQFISVHFASVSHAHTHAHTHTSVCWMSFTFLCTFQ